MLPSLLILAAAQQAVAAQDCSGVFGNPCIFPFLYEDSLYYSCVKVPQLTSALSHCLAAGVRLVTALVRKLSKPNQRHCPGIQVYSSREQKQKQINLASKVSLSLGWAVQLRLGKTIVVIVRPRPLLQ